VRKEIPKKQDKKGSHTLIVDEKAVSFFALLYQIEFATTDNAQRYRTEKEIHDW